MYKCNYCGRVTIEKHDTCPGCSSNDFTRIESYNFEIIKTPPKGGYRLFYDKFGEQLKMVNPIKGLVKFAAIPACLFFGIFIVIGIQGLLHGSQKELIPALAFIVIPIISIIIILYRSFANQGQVNKVLSGYEERAEKVRQLCMNGILVKNVPFEIKRCTELPENVEKYRIVVEFEIEPGKLLTLTSDARTLDIIGAEQGKMDVLIDPNDYNNYYIDIEIY